MQYTRISQLLFLLLIVFMAAFPAAGQIPSSDSALLLLQESYRFFDSPVNPDWYLIRPGDQLRATFIGARISPMTFGVDPEGRIVDQSLGIIELSGTNLTEARERLGAALSRHYTVDDIDIAIVDPRRVSVTISGAVTNPGLYIGFTSQRVSEIIQQAGGIHDDGSRRNIQFESSKRMLRVDLDRAHYLGDQSFDPPLYAGTHVYVPTKSDALIHVIGAVVYPRDIEFVEGDKLDEVILLAGGLSPSADAANLTVTASGATEPHSQTELHPGDVVFAPRLRDSDTERTVKLFGAVTRPGIYTIKANETLVQLVDRASGFTSTANPSMTTIFRQVRTDEYQSIGSVRYPIAAGPDNYERFGSSQIKSGDSIYVPALLDFVRVRGAVPSPSYVPYKRGQSAQYYIDMCGGFAIDADSESIGLFNRVAGLSTLHSVQVIVRDGDEIEVRRREMSR